MKKLKLDHNLAALVLSGRMRSTWRLFDDKDLSVNDQVELIDKTQAIKPETWRPIGFAKISKIVEKKLSDITQDDLDQHQDYLNMATVIPVFQKFYGSNVGPNTAVKIVDFDFQQISSTPNQNSTANHEPKLMRVKLYTDGGSRGNPGPSASGFVILDDTETVIVDKGIYLGVTTNNQAEYQALKLGLEEVLKLGAREVDVYMDSLLVINQMKGIFKVKNRDLWPINESIKQLCSNFQKIHFTHVPREFNKLADTAVNRALDSEIK